MNPAIDIAFYGAVALYVAAAATGVAYLRHANDRLLLAADVMALGSGLALLATFAMRALQWGRVPLTTMTD